jgi:hypothetical protein
MEEAKKRQLDDGAEPASEKEPKRDRVDKALDAHKVLEKLGRFIYEWCLENPIDGNDDFCESLPEGATMERSRPVFSVDGKKYHLALVVESVGEELGKVHLLNYQ